MRSNMDVTTVFAWMRWALHAPESGNKPGVGMDFHTNMPTFFNLNLDSSMPARARGITRAQHPISRNPHSRPLSHVHGNSHNMSRCWYPRKQGSYTQAHHHHHHHEERKCTSWWGTVTLLLFSVRPKVMIWGWMGCPRNMTIILVRTWMLWE